MSTKRQQEFDTFADAVDAALHERREIRQDLVDKLNVNKGNLSKIINGKRPLTSEMLGRIEGALGYKINEEPNGKWTLQKIEQATNLQRLIDALEQKLPDDNNIELFADSPLQALEVVEKLVREYRLLLEKKGQKE